MWILTPQQPGAEAHYLHSGKEHVVGRKNCDILLPSDQSISRAHAHLTASDQALVVKDTSKYGTFVNSQQITAPVNLKSGDLVTFGVFNSKFSVVHVQPVVCSSCLDSDGKAALSQALSALGGKLVNSWSQDCTHLVMSSVKVTIKTISALLCCRPIVKPEFFSELNRAVQQKSPPPKAESFVPEIDEPSLNKEDVNLGAIPLRKQLFTGKTFIFLSAKQLKRLNAAVSLGGGRSHLLEEGCLPRDLLESLHSCVVDSATSTSQTLLSPSTTEWASSVKSIVQRKGLRLITESEIGLAAIYASCEKYCNPSSPDSDSLAKVTPRIPSASLSQSIAVDETVLPAASQNITAYAVNTEMSQRMQVREVAGVTSVGETPEKKQNQDTSQRRGSDLVAQKTATQCVVAETMSSSFAAVANTESQKKKKPDSKVAGEGSSAISPPPPTPKTNTGMKKFPPMPSPHKPKISPQASPQKQSTLTNFFQSVSKKRPLEDELSATVSEPKRPVLESPITARAPNISATSEDSASLPHRSLAAVSQNSLRSASDLFRGQSEGLSEEPRNRKRKEMEDVIQMEELESIMSEDMDCFDEKPSINHSQQAKLVHNSAKPKQVLNPVESSSKRQRVHLEGNRAANQRPRGPEKESSLHKNGQRSEQHVVCIKTKPIHPTDYMTTNQESIKPAEIPSASTSNVIPFEEDDVSFIEDLELLDIDIPQIKEEPKSPLKPAVIKQEVQESKHDEDPLKKLLLVEFKSLIVAAPPPKAKQNQKQDNGCTKNFKCFRKNRVPGLEGFRHIIGGSDLLVHSRGANSDLDEWMKDAAEEERQSRKDETIGDDLFRYNPTKLKKRR